MALLNFPISGENSDAMGSGYQARNHAKHGLRSYLAAWRGNSQAKPSEVSAENRIDELDARFLDDPQIAAGLVAVCLEVDNYILNGRWKMLGQKDFHSAIKHIEEMAIMRARAYFGKHDKGYWLKLEEQRRLHHELQITRNSDNANR